MEEASKEVKGEEEEQIRLVERETEKVKSKKKTRTFNFLGYLVMNV